MRMRRLVIFAVLLLPLVVLVVLAYYTPKSEQAQPQAAQELPKPRYKIPTNRAEAIEFFTKRLAELEATSEEDWIKQNALSDGTPSEHAPKLGAVKQYVSNELDRVKLMSDEEWQEREQKKKDALKPKPAPSTNAKP